MDAEKKIVDLTKSSNGGGGGGTSDYTDLSNKPKINNVTLSGNKTSAQLGLVGDVQINGTSVTTDGVANITAGNLKTVVREVKSAYTLIEATASTYNLAINNCYGQIPSQTVTYTLPAVTAGVDNWVKIFVDTTTTASIAIASADSKTINPNGTADLQTGHKYIIVCQFNNLKDEWEVYIIDGGAV